MEYDNIASLLFSFFFKPPQLDCSLLHTCACPADTCKKISGGTHRNSALFHLCAFSYVSSDRFVALVFCHTLSRGNVSPRHAYLWGGPKVSSQCAFSCEISAARVRNRCGQQLQKYGFSPACTFKCSVKSAVRENCLLQKQQVNSFSPACAVKSDFCVNRRQHPAHLEGFCPVCVLACVAKSNLSENFSPHTEQAQGFPPLCSTF